MEYLVEFYFWLKEVKINLGMGINISMFSIFMFPVICATLKLLLSTFFDHIGQYRPRSIGSEQPPLDLVAGMKPVDLNKIEKGGRFYLPEKGYKNG